MQFQIWLMWYILFNGFLCHVHFQSSPVIDPILLLLAILCAAFALGALLLVCDLIERMSYAFTSIGDMVDQYKWYSFTREMQQILLIIFTHVNEPVTVKCFGNITCSRATFKSVSFIEKKKSLFWKQNLLRIWTLFTDCWFLIFILYGASSIWHLKYGTQCG